MSELSNCNVLFKIVQSFSVSLSQMSNRTVRVFGTLSGNIVLAERLNYEERTRYLIIVQANVRLLSHKISFNII